MVVSVNFTRPIRTARSCRNRVPATYTFGKVTFYCISSTCLIYHYALARLISLYFLYADEYDKMIDDAVEETM